MCADAWPLVDHHSARSATPRRRVSESTLRRPTVELLCQDAQPSDRHRSRFAPRHRPLPKPRHPSHHGVMPDPFCCHQAPLTFEELARARRRRDDEALGRKAAAQVHQVRPAACRFAAGLNGIKVSSVQSRTLQAVSPAAGASGPVDRQNINSSPAVLIPIYWNSWMSGLAPDWQMPTPAL